MEIEIVYKKSAEVFAEDCAKIFDENNKGFIVYRQGIFDHKNFNLLVALFEGKPVAYQIVYIGGDFVAKEGYKEYSDKFTFENDAIYIWDMCTKKGFENRQIQQKLIMFLIDFYKDKNIYSLTDIENYNSVHLQEKLGFSSVGEFVGHYGETYKILKHNSARK